MHHILTNGKYYLFSVLFHIFLIILLSAFVSAPKWENSLQGQGSQEKVLKVSFNKNNNLHATTKNNFQNSSLEKNRESMENIISDYNNEELISNSIKNYQGDSESTIASLKQGSYEAGFFKKAHLLSEIIPVYPAYAVKRGIEGTVLIDANIDALGRVSKTEIVVSSEYDILDKAAISCVKKARFAPATYLGHPATDILRIAVNFYLKNYD